jgi:hypothetical protein
VKREAEAARGVDEDVGAARGAGGGAGAACDGNKSLYLVFVGVVFLSILDCF